MGTVSSQLLPFWGIMVYGPLHTIITCEVCDGMHLLELRDCDCTSLYP